MGGPFVHNIDPVIGRLGGFYLWWYGAAYTIGLLGAFLWIFKERRTLAMGLRDVFNLNILLALGVLLGGRIVEVVFYEWPYYGSHPWYIPAVWLGGMATHGILLGAILAVGLFCKRTQRSFLDVMDVLVIAGAFVMGLGRIGNFIDGQIVGGVTNVCWAVKFPDAEGFRHPVVLYDGLKNLMLVPCLYWIKKSRPPRGVVFGHFVLWYGFLRFFIDFFREYPTTFLGFPPGQEFNVGMTVIGSAMIFWAYKKRKEAAGGQSPAPALKREPGLPRVQPVVFLLQLVFSLVIASDWTQDIPKRYGKRHPGLSYSVLYPEIETDTETAK